MMQALQIVSQSWPLAAMFAFLCVACVTVYIVRSIRENEERDRMYKASVARDVTPVARHKYGDERDD